MHGLKITSLLYSYAACQKKKEQLLQHICIKDFFSPDESSAIYMKYIFDVNSSNLVMLGELGRLPIIFCSCIINGEIMIMNKIYGTFLTVICVYTFLFWSFYCLKFLSVIVFFKLKPKTSKIGKILKDNTSKIGYFCCCLKYVQRYRRPSYLIIIFILICCNCIKFCNIRPRLH